MASTVVLMTTQREQDRRAGRDERESRWARVVREAGPGFVAMGWMVGMPMHPALRSVARAGAEARRQRSAQPARQEGRGRPAVSAAEVLLGRQPGQLRP